MRSYSAAIFLLLAFGTGFVQVTSSQSAAPTPQQQEQGPDFDTLHHLRRSTVSLGLRKNGKFVTIGSAVMIALDPYHACLLTAKHVVSQPDVGYSPSVLYVRLPQNQPRSADDLGLELPLVINGVQTWQGAVDADLAVTPLPNNLQQQYKDLHAIRLQDFGGADDIYQGPSIVVLGYPDLLGSDYQTTPIARGGIVAWTDPNGPLDHTFLIDANVYNGNSGGPVFHLPTGVSRSGSFTLGGSAKLIGIVSKDAVEQAPIQAGSAGANYIDPTTGAKIPLTARVQNIGGIGIVEPASKARALAEAFFHAYGL